jgi:uncharacterized protein YjbI with pentapeptide repeats
MGANLSKTDLTRANFYGVRLQTADLTGADLTGADLRETFLNGTKLEGAIFHNTKCFSTLD